MEPRCPKLAARAVLAACSARSGPDRVRRDWVRASGVAGSATLAVRFQCGIWDGARSGPSSPSHTWNRSVEPTNFAGSSRAHTLWA